MEGHDPRVEVGQHGDAADDGLGGDAERDDQREPAQVAATRTARPRRTCRSRPRPARRSASGCRTRSPSGRRSAPCGVKRLVGAPRPGRAAEPGAGEPDDAAGDDDADVDHDRRPRPAAQPVVEVPQPVTRSVDHSHLKVLAVRTVPSTAQTSSTPRSRQATPPSMNASRIASPSAPDGSHRTTSPSVAVRRERQHDAAAGQQQQVDQVGRGERGLGAQDAGDEEPERGERRRAEAGSASATPTHAGLRRPSRAASRRRR